jgi:hypothetical protein
MPAVAELFASIVSRRPPLLLRDDSITCVIDDSALGPSHFWPASPFRLRRSLVAARNVGRKTTLAPYWADSATTSVKPGRVGNEAGTECKGTSPGNVVEANRNIMMAMKKQWLGRESFPTYALEIVGPDPWRTAKLGIP